MTEIVLAHDQKYVPGHYFLVGLSASPKRTPSEVMSATQECHAADTGHDTPPCHTIQTQDMTPHPVTVYRHRT